MQKKNEYDKIITTIKQTFLTFIKGVLVGMANIIPGICSALVSMMLGIYDQLLDVLAYFYVPRIILKNLSLSLGIVFGIVVTIIGMSLIFKNYQAFLEAYFLGLSIIGFLKLSKKSLPFSTINIVYITIGISVSLLPIFLQNYGVSTNNIIILIVSGFFSALAFIMPGISGSLLLLTMGVYQLIITSIFEFIKNPFHLDWRGSTGICAVFGISFVLGTVLGSRFIKKILLKYQKTFYSLCIGLLIGSIANIGYSVCCSLSQGTVSKMVLIFLGIISMCVFKEKE